MNVQELGFQKTRLGDLVLRRRVETLLDDRDVFEVKLGDEYLMSSLFTEAEQQLATLGLAPLSGELDIVIGGLGLGYTAAEALKNKSVRHLLVIDLFQAVIDWHHDRLVPNGDILTKDARCELRQGDFFELARTGFDTEDPERKFDAILLDIDHSPEHFLDAGNKSLYTSEGLASIRNQLKPKACFALWSNDPANEDFTAHLRSAFGSATSHNIEFPNPYTNSLSVNSVYVARVIRDESGRRFTKEELYNPVT
ncbi:MAG: spermidine synthase [Acidobacteria bacterium]|nr:MAG: spermidine synthase [Acidobacteriota bacterium]